MSDKDTLRSERTELINKLAEMQKQFIAMEHEQGVSGKDYWGSKDGLLADYREKYAEMSTRLVDLSHEIVGSSRHM
jgi:enoyl reductase-like protein